MTKFEKLLNVITKKHVYIQTHNFPDQDAIASAYGMKILLRKFGIDSTIIYEGVIDKANTLALIDHLNIKLFDITKIKALSKDDEIIIVDAQKGNRNITDFVGEEIACIDHHESIDLEKVRFTDVRPEVGACASIICEYFWENNIEIEEKLATILLYGLKMDTNNMSRGVSDLDIEVAYRLYKIADLAEIKRLDACCLKVSDLNAYASAITNLRIYDSLGIARIDEKCSDAILGTLSDFILSLDGLYFSVIYTRRKGGFKISVRSAEKNVDAAVYLRKAMDKFGSSGGHPSMAAGFVKTTDENFVEIENIVINNFIEMF